MAFRTASRLAETVSSAVIWKMPDRMAKWTIGMMAWWMAVRMTGRKTGRLSERMSSGLSSSA